MCLDDLLLKTYFQLTQSEREYVLREYLTKTKKNLCLTCNASFIEAYNNLKRMSKPVVIIENKCKYRFKKGFEDSQIHTLNFGLITSENLTDEICESILANHPHIEIKPKND